MDEAIEIVAAVDILQRVLLHERRRTAHGAAIRNHIHKELALGNEPDHYRLEWLCTSVRSVVKLIGLLGEEFNREHPNDKVSTNDLLDILSSAHSTVLDTCNGD